MRLQILTIARNTFVESIRQPIVFILVLLCGVLTIFSLFNTGFQMGYTDSSEVSGDNKLLLELGLATVFVVGVLLAAFVATAAVSREIENKTVLTVVSKPVARPALVVGKYLGVAGAILLALIPTLVFLLMALRHGVMSTAADELDQPVILFTFLAVAASFLVALWCNFFYGSYFSQTFLVMLAPAMVLAYVVVLMFDKRWHIQAPTADFKPQITLSCATMVMAVMVLTAVATAVSTRLGQVMTVVICSGVFMFGLLSDYLIGRHAFGNRWVGVIQTVRPADSNELMFGVGTFTNVTLRNSPRIAVRPGDSFYYGPSPNGFPMAIAAYTPFEGDPTNTSVVFGPQTRPALVVTGVEGQKLTIRKVGADPLSTWRFPIESDYVFLEPTHINAVALGGWALVPNMQFFWLMDALNQNQKVPPSHFALLGAYALAQITFFLGLGIVLFQRRDVG